MAYGRVRTDNMSGTTNGKELVSFKYQPSATDTAIENGNVVVIGNLITGEREVHTATTPAANTALGLIALVASEEIVKDEKRNTLGEFRNEAGSICRGYYLTSHDLFSVTADAVDIEADYTVVKGGIVELQAGTKLSIVSSLTANSTKVGTIEDIEGDWYVIRVV